MDQRLPEAAVTDWRGLCSRMADELDSLQERLELELGCGEEAKAHPLAAEARAALAEPEPEVVGPSFEEVEDLCEEHCFNVEGYESIECLQGLINDALSRWGRPAPVPAEGDVAELVTLLRAEASDDEIEDHLLWMTSADARRAADLMERLAAPVLEPALARINDILNDSGRIFQTDELEALELARQALEQRHPAPVPVSERLPGPGDCDGEGRCYAWDRLASAWRMVPAEWVQTKPDYNWWLPAHALPLPSGEVEP